jgi:predicted ribosomally synthesized peptide with SipW-like signal peptide
MDKKKIISLLAAGVMVLGVTLSMGTGAWFTDSKASANAFKAGTLKLGEPGTITSGMTIDNIYPGWTESKTVTISNQGSLDLKYKMNVSPLDNNLLYDGQTPLQVNVNNQGFVDINKLGDVYLGEISARTSGTFVIAFKLPAAATNSYENQIASFNFNFTAAQLNDTSFTVNNIQQLVVIKNVSDLSTAIKNQKDGQTWVIKSGNYGLLRNNDIMAGGQTGWYMPITASNLTIRGEGNPIIYGNEYSANGVWATQDLVAAFGNNITLKGLTLMPKLEGNKTVEVIGANFRIEDCTIEPNILADTYANDNNEDRQWGGSLYFSGAGNHVVKNVTIKNAGISFRYSPAGTNITFDNVNIINNTNVDWINSYRYSSGFNNANCSITGLPKVTYVVDNNMNNYNSVVSAALAGDTVIDKVNDETTLKTALANNKISNIELSQDITLTSEASITRAVTIDGKNHAVKGTFSKTDNSNNSLLGIMDKTNGVTIKNLTADGTGSTKLHGINISSATDITLENVTVQNNQNSGVTVNSSMVTVKNITTKHNGWGGINVSLGSQTTNIPAQLTVVGASVHQESLNDIWIDNAAWTNVNVIGDTAQYTIKTVNGVKCFNLNPSK